MKPKEGEHVICLDSVAIEVIRPKSEPAATRLFTHRPTISVIIQTGTKRVEREMAWRNGCKKKKGTQRKKKKNMI